MQKKIIALAVAGLMSGAAFAQSNVTISGNVEVQFENVGAKGATAAGANSQTRNRISDHTSALRFSGTEDLGGGMKAFFQVEADMGVSNGSGATAANGNQFLNRNSAVGLTGNFGTVLMGHWDAHYQAQLEGGVDFGSSGALSHHANSMNLTSQVTGAGQIGNRLANVIAYTTPTFAGLSARIARTMGSESTVAGTPKDSGTHLFVKYANGPINAFWSNLRTNDNYFLAAAGATATPAATAGNDVRADKLGAAYSMGGIKVGLVYDRTKADAAAGLFAKRTAWSIPVSYTMGNNAFYFAYAKAGKVTNAAGTVADSGAKNVILGYTYAMSKRTSLGVSYSKINNDAAAAYDFWTRGVGGVAAGADPKSLSMGINHSF